MKTGLEGKVAIVTGGSRGIGRAVAARLLDEGARVLLVARKREVLEATCRELGEGASFHATNVGDETGAREAIDAAMSRFGRIDVLVNNASTNPYFGPLMEIDRERAERTTQVNQWGAVLWTQLAWKAWMSSHGGRVVNVSSMGGLLPEPNIGWYNGTKAAIIQLTRQMAQELGPRVTVNCVAPGVIRTDMSKAIWQRHEAAIAGRVPVARLGEPEDIAGAVVFLASDQAAYITGQTLVVDGGITLGQGVVPG
jgi:NAD(P)-dependent dehydrogenase (short-subunit alcohol dehydrogenase family)